MYEKVLIVDDDSNILEAFRRQLRKPFQERAQNIRIDTATSGKEGLEFIEAQGPYAVIVSDMQMPGMDGIQFLWSARAASPDSVRVMLTGNADMNTAIEAVNEGRIFRFLTKPCSTETLAGTLLAGIEQYRLVTAERELLEKTLSGSVKVITDILALVNPVAFSQATRFRRYVQHIISKLHLSNAWQFEVAAMLSQIGCVTLPPDLLEKVYAGSPLTKDEKAMFASHPSVGHDLLIGIPRLQPVAKMIEKQQEPYNNFALLKKANAHDSVTLGAQILNVVSNFDRYIMRGMTAKEAAAELLELPETFNPRIVYTLDTLEIGRTGSKIQLVKIRDLDMHMIIDQEIWTNRGILVVPKGQEINHSVQVRLRNFSRSGVIPDQVRVQIPQFSVRDTNRAEPELKHEEMIAVKED